MLPVSEQRTISYFKRFRMEIDLNGLPVRCSSDACGPISARRSAAYAFDNKPVIGTFENAGSP